MTERGRPDRNDTREENAEALRETRRELDEEIARIPDTGEGAAALEQPALPDHSHGSPKAPETGRDHRGAS